MICPPYRAFGHDSPEPGPSRSCGSKNGCYFGRYRCLGLIFLRKCKHFTRKMGPIIDSCLHSCRSSGIHPAEGRSQIGSAFGRLPSAALRVLLGSLIPPLDELALASAELASMEIQHSWTSGPPALSIYAHSAFGSTDCSSNPRLAVIRGHALLRKVAFGEPRRGLRPREGVRSSAARACSLTRSSFLRPRSVAHSSLRSPLFGGRAAPTHPPALLEPSSHMGDQQVDHPCAPQSLV